ncbi:unnamed protein product [Nezara viridula]|uniref:Uncharacterized protein n=1 Tax=Nezara viridula TaxID=85310 RepID=A0A9P0MU01_NEZVI|nr:unnamed protein product [Nezara viridula]
MRQRIRNTSTCAWKMPEQLPPHNAPSHHKVKHELMRLLKERDYACFEEVYCIDTNGSTRYADIVDEKVGDDFGSYRELKVPREFRAERVPRERPLVRSSRNDTRPNKELHGGPWCRHKGRGKANNTRDKATPLPRDPIYLPAPWDFFLNRI